MTLTIELPDHVETALRAAAEAEGRPVEEIAVEAVAAYVEEEFEEDVEAIEGIRRGLEAVAAGEVMSFEDYVAEVMEKRRQRDATRKRSVSAA